MYSLVHKVRLKRITAITNKKNVGGPLEFVITEFDYINLLAQKLLIQCVFRDLAKLNLQMVVQF